MSEKTKSKKVTKNQKTKLISNPIPIIKPPIKNVKQPMTDYMLSIDLGTRNFSYCVLDIKNESILKWDCVELAKNMKGSHEKVCSSLANKLHELKLTQVPDAKATIKCENKKNMIIVIELQPKVNTKTVVMSGEVIMYYVLEKRFSSNSSNNLDFSICNITKIVGYHARNKLRYYQPRPGDKPLALDHIKNGYYKNKKTAIEHCKRVLIQKKEKQKWIDIFNNSKKLDDFSDSYLMGLAYKKFVMNGTENPEGSNRPKREKKRCKGLTKQNELCKSIVSKRNMYCKKHIRQKYKNPRKSAVKKITKPKNQRKPHKQTKIKKVAKLCKGSTQKGEPCKYKASAGLFCKIHSA